MTETSQGDMGGWPSGVQCKHGHSGKWALVNASMCGHVWLNGSYGVKALEQVAQCLTSNKTSRL